MISLLKLCPAKNERSASILLSVPFDPPSARSLQHNFPLYLPFYPLPLPILHNLILWLFRTPPEVRFVPSVRNGTLLNAPEVYSNFFPSLTGSPGTLSVIHCEYSPSPKISVGSLQTIPLYQIAPAVSHHQILLVHFSSYLYVLLLVPPPKTLSRYLSVTCGKYVYVEYSGNFL